VKEKIKQHYTEYGIREWRRLVKNPYHRLEFDTTMHFLKKYLPKKALILDAGGGPGRYTIELAKLGYDLVLLDLTPKLLKIAQREIKKAQVESHVKQIIEGSFDDLSMFENNAFDAIICFGSLGHLLHRKQREQAIDELIRVTKKDAPLFLSVIGRLAVLLIGLVRAPEELKINGLYQHIYNTGDYEGDYGFTACHFYLPEELEASLNQRKVKILKAVGLEGLATMHRREINKLYRHNSELWKKWWDLHLLTCTHPTAVGISEHFMIICKKL
jgi:ubiquinone/menaquinone biosynthesis C-methylase UbiE